MRKAAGMIRGAVLKPFMRSGKYPGKNPVANSVREELVGLGDNGKIVDELLLRIERGEKPIDRYNVLKKLHQVHPRPYLVNYLLGQEESKGGVEVMAAYPAYVLMDISNICTVECRFCKYVHNYQDKRWLTLDEIKQIEWLRYPRYLNFTAGTAEALSNPHFIPIFEHVVTSNPHLVTALLTNGRTLHEKVLRALEGRMNELHISMNACTEEDYNQIIANGSWELFSRNMKAVKEFAKRSTKPWIQASFVKMRWNLDRAVAELDFAAEHGARKVLFHHFYPHYLKEVHGGDAQVLADKFSGDQSLYYEQERADDVFAQVRERGKALGVEVETPPPFSKEANILWGVRNLSPAPKDCYYPWTHMFLLWGWKSRRTEITLCCGLASDTGIYFDWPEMFTCTGMMKTWNSPTMQAYRKSVNGSRVNPICAMCRKVDRFNPKSVYPDQRKFFQFNDLPVPPHFTEQSSRGISLPMTSSGSGSCCA
jgi:MoaA/NifB/PqqE/SkfB family radical SAM enzyme